MIDFNSQNALYLFFINFLGEIMNNNSINNAIRNISDGQSLIHFYGSHAVKIAQDAQGQEQLVLKSLSERIALYISAVFIYYTGTAQYFDLTFRLDEQRQVEQFLKRNFNAMTHEIGLLEGRRSGQINQNGQYASLPTGDILRTLRGWNSADFRQSAVMSYVGYAFNPDWKTTHTFSQVHIDAVSTYNNLNCFQYIKDHIADCTDQALIYVMQRNARHMNEIIDLLPIERLERIVLCNNPIIAKACKEKIMLLVLEQLRTEKWPEDTLEQLRQGQHSPWLNEKFKKLGYHDYEKRNVFDSMKDLCQLHCSSDAHLTALKAVLYKLVKIVDTYPAVYTIDVETNVFSQLYFLLFKYQDLNIPIENTVQASFTPFIRNETVCAVLFKLSSTKDGIKKICCEHITKHFQDTNVSLLEKYLAGLATTKLQYEAIAQFLDSCTSEKPVALITQSIKKLNVAELLMMAIDQENPLIESYCLDILLQERTLLEKFLIGLTIQDANVEMKLEQEDLEKLQLNFIDKYIKHYVETRSIHSYQLLEEAIARSDTALNLIYQTIKKLNLRVVYSSQIALPHAFDNEAFSDFTIMIKDLQGKSKEVKVNSTLLSARNKMLAKYIQDAQDYHLELITFDIEVQQDILEFFYTHDFPRVGKWNIFVYGEWNIYCESARKLNATSLIDTLCKRFVSDVVDMNYLETYFWLMQHASDESHIGRMFDNIKELFETNLNTKLQNINLAKRILSLAASTIPEAKGFLLVVLKELIQEGVTLACGVLMHLDNRREVAAKNLKAFIKEYQAHIKKLDCSDFYKENKFLPDLFKALPSLEILKVGRNNKVSHQLALALKKHAKQLQKVDLSFAETTSIFESDKILNTLQAMGVGQVITKDFTFGGYNSSDNEIHSDVEVGDNSDDEVEIEVESDNEAEVPPYGS